MKENIDRQDKKVVGGRTERQGREMPRSQSKTVAKPEIEFNEIAAKHWLASVFFEGLTIYILFIKLK